MKNFTFSRRNFRDLQNLGLYKDHKKYLGGYKWLNWHRYLIMDAVERYQSTQQNRSEPLGRILAICADYKEAVFLHEFPFQEILLSGISDPDDKLQNIMQQDSRISHKKENSENISLPSRSYDLVFCKDGLHHLARPIQGLYEMLRVCKKAVIIIEGYDCLLTRILEAVNIASVYERNIQGNIKCRDNYVFRWGKRHLQQILNSFYLDSGYHVYMTLGWVSDRATFNRLRIIKLLGNCLGCAISYLPGFEGNTMTAIITPGIDIPPDPIAVSERDQNSTPTVAW